MPRYTEPITPPALSGTLSGTRSKLIYTDMHVRKMLYLLVRREGSLEKAGNKIGVTKAFVSQVLRGGKGPGEKIADYFGLDRHVVYTLTRGRVTHEVAALNAELRVNDDTANAEGDASDTGQGGGEASDGRGEGPTTATTSGGDESGTTDQPEITQ